MPKPPTLQMSGGASPCPPPLQVPTSALLHTSPLDLEDNNDDHEGSHNHHRVTSSGLWSFLKRKDDEVARALAVDEALLMGELRRQLTGASPATTPRRNDPPPVHSHHIRRVFPGRSEALRHSGAPTVAEATLQRASGASQTSSTSWLHYALERFAKKLVSLFDMREAALEEIGQNTQPAASAKVDSNFSNSGSASSGPRLPELIFARDSATMDPYLHGAISFPHEWDALVQSSVPPEHQQELGAVVHLFQFVAFQVAAAEKRHRNLQWENDVLRRKLAGKEGALSESEAAATGRSNNPNGFLEEVAAAAAAAEAAAATASPTTLHGLDDVITNTTLRSVFLHQTQLYRESLATLVSAQQEELVALRQAKVNSTSNTPQQQADHHLPKNIEFPELYVAAQLGALAVGESVVNCVLRDQGNNSSAPTYLATGSQSLCDSFHGGRHMPHRHSLPSLLQTVASSYKASSSSPTTTPTSSSMPYHRMLTPNTSRNAMAQDIVGAVLGFAGVEVGLGASGKMTPVPGNGEGRAALYQAVAAAAAGRAPPPPHSQHHHKPPFPPAPPQSSSPKGKHSTRRKHRGGGDSSSEECEEGSEGRGAMVLSAESCWVSDEQPSTKQQQEVPKQQVPFQPRPPETLHHKLDANTPRSSAPTTVVVHSQNSDGGGLSQRHPPTGGPPSLYIRKLKADDDEEYSRGGHTSRNTTQQRPAAGPLAYMNQVTGTLVTLANPNVPPPMTGPMMVVPVASMASQPLSHRTPRPSNTIDTHSTPNPPRGRLLDHMPPQSLTARLVRNNNNTTTTTQSARQLQQATASVYARDIQETKRRRDDMVALEKQLYDYKSNFPSKVSQNVHGMSDEERERAKIRETIKRHNDTRLRKVVRGGGGDGESVGGSQESTDGHSTTTTPSTSVVPLPAIHSPRRPPKGDYDDGSGDVILKSTTNFSKVASGDKSEVDSYLRFLDSIAPPIQITSSKKTGGE